MTFEKVLSTVWVYFLARREIPASITHLTSWLLTIIKRSSKLQAALTFQKTCLILFNVRPPNNFEELHMMSIYIFLSYNGFDVYHRDTLYSVHFQNYVENGPYSRDMPFVVHHLISWVSLKVPAICSTPSMTLPFMPPTFRNPRSHQCDIVYLEAATSNLCLNHIEHPFFLLECNSLAPSLTLHLPFP